jgi:NADH-quinone oxidoreductase subunit F
MNKVDVIVGMGSCGLAAGAGKVWDKLAYLRQLPEADFTLSQTSCIGMCYREPLVEVRDKNGSVLYGDIDEEKATLIFQKHVTNGEVINDWVVRSDYLSSSDDTFFRGQLRIALRNCGIIDPGKIEHYINRGGYIAVKRIADEHITSDTIINEILTSGLRGRGGGGFSTGRKWLLTAQAPGKGKYIICNADEGDPGAFMDRSLLEGDPHSVLEGMIICAYAVGASEGVIYCRAEYPLAVKRLKEAIEQACKNGFLGKDASGIKDFNFNIHLKEGAGAFVCGEETALIASVEGRRGMPCRKPPYPAESGLWSKPTCINNVETFANVPWIITHGAEAYTSVGTEGSKGTKVFALTGKIRHGGLAEVPMGITINEIIYGIGGGIRDDHPFKAVQLGGPSGGCIPASLGNTIIDYESLTSTGAIMGSGGMVVMDDSNCMVDVTRFFLDFTCKESCGKCTFCRLGTKRLLEILNRICGGDGREEDLVTLRELSEQVRDNSLCGLGQTAPNPVITTMRYFEDEYRAHIIDKKCPAGVCTKLLTYTIISDNCTGCTLCASACPVSAISGERKKVHLIDQKACIRCGLCFNKCTFSAIDKR